MLPNQKKILTLIALAVGLGGHVLLQAQLGCGLVGSVCVWREVFECRVTASYCQCVKLSRLPRRLLLTDPEFKSRE